MSVKYKFLNNVTGILFLIRLRIPIFLLTLLHKREIWSYFSRISMFASRILMKEILAAVKSLLTLQCAVLGQCR